MKKEVEVALALGDFWCQMGSVGMNFYVDSLMEYINFYN